MARYATDLRTSRQELIRQVARNGRLYLCDGSPPAGIAIPASPAIISTHLFTSEPGFASDGLLAFNSASFTATPVAAKTSAPTYAVLANAAGVPKALFLIPADMTLTINSGASSSITEGFPVQIQSLSVQEGNAA